MRRALPLLAALSGALAATGALASFFSGLTSSNVIASAIVSPSCLRPYAASAAIRSALAIASSMSPTM